MNVIAFNERLTTLLKEHERPIEINMTTTEAWKENYPIYKDITQQRDTSDSNFKASSPILTVKRTLSSRKIKPSVTKQRRSSEKTTKTYHETYQNEELKNDMKLQKKQSNIFEKVNHSLSRSGSGDGPHQKEIDVVDERESYTKNRTDNFTAKEKTVNWNVESETVLAPQKDSLAGSPKSDGQHNNEIKLSKTQEEEKTTTSKPALLSRQRSLATTTDQETQVDIPRAIVSPRRHIHHNTQTIATQTSSTMFSLTKSPLVSHLVHNSMATVTKQITVQPKALPPHILGTVANLPVPPTPDGARFSQDGTQLTFTHPAVQNDTFMNLHAMQTRGIMCDVLIRVRDIDFKAHKIVLSAACPYFSELFKDIKTVRIDRLMLEGLSPHAVASMLGYFYLAKLIIDVEDVEELLDAAYYFKTDEVVQLCTEYLELNLNIHNCLNFYNLSIKHNMEGLKAKTFRYICWNFNSIVHDLRFLEASVDTIAEVISSNSVKVKAEEEVYKFVWDWYRYNMEDRKAHLPKMTMYLHFEVMELDFLENRVKTEMYLESALCKKKVDDAIMRIKHKIDEDDRKLSKFRQVSDNIYIFNSSSSNCQMLDIKTCKYSDAKELQLPGSIDQSYHVTVTAGKTLYTLSKSKVIMFNSNTMNWDVVSDGIPISDAGICSNKSTIYVIGGKPDGKIGWEFNTRTRKWERLTDMLQDRRSPAVAVMGNTKPRVFVAGGYSLATTNVLDTMQFYTAADKTWKQIKQNMIQPRFQASMIIHNDKVFVVGGRSMEKTWDTAEYYDRATSKWQSFKGTLCEEKIDSSLIEYEGRIYCIGGQGCSTVEVLQIDGKKMEWVYVGKLDNTAVSCSCVVYEPV